MNRLGKKILKDVSRSFYLSIRVLPKPMREPISLGYLLARASDTLADTEVLDPQLRLDLLEEFQLILQNDDYASWLAKVSTEVIPKQTHEGERVLLENMEGVFLWLDGVPEHELEAIQTVMGHILKGQRLDIERFERQKDFSFSSDAQLEEYCYLVAGCVGEFWSDIGEITLEEFSVSQIGQLHEWGANYGRGLQLINILRDLPNDLKAGRCYLPNVDPQNHEELLIESARWRHQAREYLADGRAYAASLIHRRTRAATALPGLIGEATLHLMDQASWEELEAGIKIPRRSVYRSAWDALIL